MKRSPKLKPTKWDALVVLAVLLLMANITFAIYDVLIDRLEIVYHVKLRPKLTL